ncbi:OmpA family protein [bacterium]|nr:OmpA family protein [bacterium]
MPRATSTFPTLRTTALLLAAFLATSFATAGSARANDRDRDGAWAFGVAGGVHKLVEGEWDYSTVEQFGGIELSRGLSSEWTLALALRAGHVRPGADEPGQEVGWSGTSSAPLYTSLTQPSLTVRHLFAPRSRFCPVAGVGLGLTSWKVTDHTGEDPGWLPGGDPITGWDTDGQSAELKGTDLTLLFELGLDVALTDALVLNLGGRYEILNGNGIDNIGLSAYWGAEDVDANTARADLYVGLTWWFGAGDSDGDGIPNDRDACPDEPEDMDGYNDLDGCPDPDNDGDGIPDADDACPTRAEDFDGFRDEDGCPDPDNDGDGIVDGRDQCPDEPEDIDGWDDRDGCPDPDNDQDGVPDERDRCPNTPPDSKVDADGCVVEVPLVEGAAALVPAATRGQVLEGVNFVSGSAELTPASIAVLAELAATLRADPGLKLEIAGHTDATGNAEANRALSSRRAESVRRSLMAMGIAGDRLIAVGYGQDFPLADNGTAEGRARNRRVEVIRQ